MSAIHVLSDIPKGGSKLEKTSTPKGKNPSDSPEDAAAVFAAMFSGVMNLNDSKGQNSKAGQESEEQQSAGNPVPSEQTLNGQINVLEYGNFMLANLFQPMLQSDLPAGKEANSGNDVSQGTGVKVTTNAPSTNAPIASGNNLGLAMLDLDSLVSDEVSASTGMTTQKPQGNNPAITELDKYRLVIANLLVELNGEITDPSLKGNRLSLEGAGTMDLRQEMAKIVQGWMTATDVDAEGGSVLGGNITDGQVQAKGEGEETKTLQEGKAISSNSLESSGPKVTRQDIAKIVESWMTAMDEVVKDGQPSNGQKGIKLLLDIVRAGIDSANPALQAKAAMLLAVLNPSHPFHKQGTEESKEPQGISEMIEVEGSVLVSEAKGSSKSYIKSLNKTNLDLVATQVKDTVSLSNVQQKPDGPVLGETKTSKKSQGIFREEIQKGNSTQATEVSGVKDVQNQNSSTGIGAASNIIATNVADGETAAVPVWEQISTVLREQVKKNSQDLKQLDIQLHPADLGKIQINLRWENGQVHLQVQASEAATGQILQNQLTDLRQTLTSQGINCGMLQMGQGGERQHNPHGDESQRTFKQSSDRDKDEDLIPVMNQLALGQDEINRINVTA